MNPIMIASLHYFVTAVGVKNLYELIDGKDRDFVNNFLKAAIFVGSVIFTVSYIRARHYLG